MHWLYLMKTLLIPWLITCPTNPYPQKPHLGTLEFKIRKALGGVQGGLWKGGKDMEVEKTRKKNMKQQWWNGLWCMSCNNHMGSMNATFWNCQALGPSLTTQRSRHRVPIWDYMLRWDKKHEWFLWNDSGTYGNGKSIDPQGMSGGLALWWKGKIDIRIHKVDRNFIDCEVKLKQ